MPTFLQWVHVTGVVIGVGGIAFLLLALTPALRGFQPEQRHHLVKRVMDRFRWLLWGAMAAILLSGLYIIRQVYWEVAWGKSWQLLTVKIVLAFIVFVIALALTLPFKLFDRVRARGRIWLAVALGLSIAIIFIAAYLRR